MIEMINNGSCKILQYITQCVEWSKKVVVVLLEKKTDLLYKKQNGNASKTRYSEVVFDKMSKIVEFMINAIQFLHYFYIFNILCAATTSALHTLLQSSKHITTVKHQQTILCQEKSIHMKEVLRTPEFFFSSSFRTTRIFFLKVAPSPSI